MTFRPTTKPRAPTLETIAAPLLLHHCFRRLKRRIIPQYSKPQIRAFHLRKLSPSLCDSTVTFHLQPSRWAEEERFRIRMHIRSLSHGNRHSPWCQSLWGEYPNLVLSSTDIVRYHYSLSNGNSHIIVSPTSIRELTICSSTR